MSDGYQEIDAYRSPSEWLLGLVVFIGVVLVFVSIGVVTYYGYQPTAQTDQPVEQTDDCCAIKI